MTERACVRMFAWDCELVLLRLCRCDNTAGDSLLLPTGRAFWGNGLLVLVITYSCPPASQNPNYVTKCGTVTQAIGLPGWKPRCNVGDVPGIFSSKALKMNLNRKYCREFHKSQLMAIKAKYFWSAAFVWFLAVGQIVIFVNRKFLWSLHVKIVYCSAKSYSSKTLFWFDCRDGFIVAARCLHYHIQHNAPHETKWQTAVACQKAVACRSWEKFTGV